MQLTNTPAKLVLPFANAGGKNTIPAASQIGITAGAASLTDGFPPLTRTPIASGGVPPSGLDMNGILYQLSAIIRWANAGGGYAYDSTFANDSNVGGYPKGARIMRSDGLGYWLNIAENNTTDPEGGSPANWVPDFTSGVAAVTMTSANVTLTPAQYGKPIVIISGTLTANLNLIFPAIAAEWVVINNTTGAFTITCKTASGTGLVVNTAALIVGDGTNIQSAVTDAVALFGETVATATGGTSDAITATFAPVPRYPSNGVPLSVRASAANSTTTPTFTPNSGVIAAATIVKGNNLPLVAGDIAGAGHWLELAWDSTLSKWVLLNPATGVTGGVQANRNNTFTKAQRGALSTLTDAATITPDFSLSNNYQVVLGGNRTLAVPTNLVAGQSGIIDIFQDTTGNRTLALAWGWSPPGGTAPSLSTAALTRDQFAYYVGTAAQSAVTISIATPGVVTWNGHGLKGGEKIQFTTTGALPTGLSAGTTYYVKPVDANTFQLSATLGGAAIATSGTQSGVQTAQAVSITVNQLKAVA